MVTVVVLSVGGLGMVGAFAYMARAVQTHRTATLATNLSQEEVEFLKNKSYFEVIPTSPPSYDSRFSPPIPYDTGLYAPTTTKIGNMPFQRLTYVERVLASGNTFVQVPPDSLDTGIKRITVTTIWQMGSTWHQVSLSNLLASSQYSNSGGFSGTVTDALTNLPIAGAEVYAKGNLLFHDFSDAGGNYVMSATPGSFTLAAQAPGYFKATPATVYTVSNGNVTQANLQLSPMATGSVSGSVYVNPNLLISQVVSSTVQAQANFDVQYIELYNPTTFTITIGNSLSHAVKLNFTSALGFTCSDIPLSYSVTSVAPSHYYLIANTSTPFTVNGVDYTADAVYSAANGDGSLGPAVCSGSGNGQCTGGGPYRVPCAGHSGTVSLTDSGGNAIDAVGWTSALNTPAGCNGTCYPLSGGLVRGDQFVRMTSTGAVVSTQGNAYNTDENNLNFAYNSPLSLSPRTSANANSPVSGTAAYGAVVTSNDGLSASTAAWQASSNGFHYATFTLVNVATGSWIVDISSGAASLELSSVTVLTNTAIPNAATVPAWPAAGFYNALLTGTTTNGIVSGQVTDPNGVPLAGITVSVQGENSGLTDGRGFFNVSAAPNTYSVTANPNNLSPNYSSQQLSNVVVATGQISNGNNFVISGAGRVNGYVCDFSAANPYPGVTINALDGNGNSVAQVVAATNGKFTINNLSTGTYTFEAVLDQDQSASAIALGLCSTASGSISCAVTAGSNVSIGTFTIAGAYGTISGNVTASGSAITTGVIVVATTGTIAGAMPPAVSSATLAGVPFYMASSLSDGSYSLSVRASTASATFNLYGWYTTYSGNTPVITKKAASVNVTGGQTSTKNLAW